MTMLASEVSKPRRIELILRQIDSLPTLPAIATRLLTLTTSDDAHAREVTELVSADPALTAKVLSLCRSVGRGTQDVLTIERAVVLLGFGAIRNAVLSVKVFELMGPEPEGAGCAGAGGSAHGVEGDGQAPRARFDRAAFWEHSLAVAVTAERLAQAARGPARVSPDEAFVCGLLHDIGKLALDHVLPKAFARVVELAELNQGDIAVFERKIVGIDHHTAGKRLAEQWGLPHRLQDCIWLHGTPMDAMPRIEHRDLVSLVALADLLARRQHLGYSGNFVLKGDAAGWAAQLGIDPVALDGMALGVRAELEQRGRAMGLHDKPSHELFMDSIQRANQTLGRLNAAMDRRTRLAAGQARVLDAVTGFHNDATPGRSVQDVLDAVAHSARGVFGEGFYALIYPESPRRERGAWLVSQYAASGRPVSSQYVEAPPRAPDISQIDVTRPLGLDLMGLLPWITDYLVDAEDLRRVQLLPLGCGWGTAALLLHDREELLPWAQLAALSGTWGAAIAAAAQHDGARRLGEELAEANAQLASVQDRLARHQSMVRLGEMAAGAAHEMNNPLAVISGRSQLLSMSLPAGSREQSAAQTIVKASHRLSDLITALHLFADPPEPQRVPVNLGRLLDDAIRAAQQQPPGTPRRGAQGPEVYLKLRDGLPSLSADPDQVRRAVTELLHNALQANPRSAVQVIAEHEPVEPAVVIRVVDDGEGMEPRVLEHAMDPFFSAKAAGRRVGMGLPRAQQWAQGHGGRLELSSTPGQGTTASLILPLDSEQ